MFTVLIMFMNIGLINIMNMIILTQCVTSIPW